MKLSKLWWLIAGKPEVEVRREQAAEYGVPFEDLRFWPAGMNWMRDLLPAGKGLHIRDRLVCPDLYDADLSAVVPVYVDADYAYQYFVRGFSWASGDDHIISPKQFHIEFAGRLALRKEAE